LSQDVTNEQFDGKLISSDQFIIDLLDDIDIEFEYHLWLKRTKGYFSKIDNSLEIFFFAFSVE